MKHRLYVFAVVLTAVLALVFAGCSNAQTGETTAPSANPGQTSPESKLYWNLEQGVSHTPGSDGNYTVKFLCDGKTVSLKVSGEALVKTIEKMSLMGLSMDDKGVVTDYIPLLHLPYARLTWEYTVISVSSGEIKTNATKLGNSNEVILKPGSDTIIMDVSEDAQPLGAPVTIESGFAVTAVADNSGKITHIFVTSRGEKVKLEEEVKYCAHCKKEVAFSMWTITDSLPSRDGHFCLVNDVTVTKVTTVTAKEGMCLDLNGKTVKQATAGTRIYNMNAACELNLMDSGETGTIIPSTTGASMNHKWGNIFEMTNDDAVLRIYGGTLDASATDAQYGNAINQAKGYAVMYGGVIKGGKAYGSGSAAVRIGGTFDMYGGTIIGGSNFYDDNNPNPKQLGGGAVGVSVGATFNLYDGTIIGGSTATNAGAVRVDGLLNMSGGSISGGKCEGNGGGVYITQGGAVILSGSARIFDNEKSNLFIETGTTLTIKDLTVGDSGAKVGITMAAPGVISGSIVAEEATGCFVSDSADYAVTRNADGWLVLEKVEK